MTPQQRRLIGPLYIAAGGLTLFPVFDQAMQLLSTVKLHDSRWRFGAVGLFSNLAILPLAGLMMMFLIAATLDQRVVQRILAIVSGIVAVVLALATGLFVLDAVQVRAIMNPAARGSWAVATSAAVVKLGVAIVATAWVAIAGMRNSRARPIPNSGRPGLVIGSHVGERSLPEDAVTRL
jgi:hypothetical protein